MKICILGAGNWGSTLGILTAGKGTEVTLWARNETACEEINQKHTHEKFLPGISFPDNITATASLKDAVQDVSLIVTTVPSSATRETAKALKTLISKKTVLVIAAKGLLQEGESFETNSQVYKKELKDNPVCVLSGPNLAREIAAGQPCASVVASDDMDAARKVQEALSTPVFRLYTHHDVLGVELGGALKNIIAICAGMSDGLGFGNNTKATIVTRGLAEIVRLGKTLGANPDTFYGLSGVGDLITTCSSPLSRNHQVGFHLAKGETLSSALEKIRYVAEGVETVKSAYNLSRKISVEMPITKALYGILFEGKNPKEAVQELMLRTYKSE